MAQQRVEPGPGRIAAGGAGVLGLLVLGAWWLAGDLLGDARSWLLWVGGAHLVVAGLLALRGELVRTAPEPEAGPVPRGQEGDAPSTAGFWPVLLWVLLAVGVGARVVGTGHAGLALLGSAYVLVLLVTVSAVRRAWAQRRSG